MNADWRLADSALRRVRVTGSENNEPVSVTGADDGLRVAGIGTDAAVFTYDRMPHYAFKLYAPHAQHKLAEESRIYARLAGLPYFPHCYGQGTNYLVLSYEPGTTLYDCLLKGVPIPGPALQDVETARHLARRRGLNPRDIHLKNVLLQGERAKVLDVSEYGVPGNDRRWEHLMWAFRMLGPVLSGRKIPEWALDAVKASYNRCYRAGRWVRRLVDRFSTKRR